MVFNWVGGYLVIEKATHSEALFAHRCGFRSALAVGACDEWKIYKFTGQKN